jgi:hypothetical protein
MTIKTEPFFSLKYYFIFLAFLINISITVIAQDVQAVSRFSQNRCYFGKNILIATMIKNTLTIKATARIKANLIFICPMVNIIKQLQHLFCF